MSEQLSKEKLDSVYEVVEVARATGKIRKGTNEATKAIEKGVAKFVVFAQDVQPAEVTMHIPLLCKEKGIPCFGVPSREELGSAAGLVVPTAAVAVVEPGNAKKLIADFSKEAESASKE
jgi:large subunit ribosomal protein L7Ae